MSTLLTSCASVSAQANEAGRSPEIEIAYSYYLDKMIADNLPDGTMGRFTPLSPEEIKKRTEGFKAEWEVREKKILTAMQSVLGLEFKEETISVYLISRGETGLSDPLVISLNYEEKKRAAVLAHELAHRLLAMNTKHIRSDVICNSMFHDEPELTRLHVVEFAVLVYIFTDVLKEPELLAGERGVVHPAYRRAWEIVKEKGYKNIIKEFRSHYE